MRSQRVVGLVAVVASLHGLSTLPAFGWGSNGHRVVGKIAQSHLTPEARQGVADLLGPLSLAQVADWPDEIKSDPIWTQASMWHYINLDDGQTFETVERNPKGDILEAIPRFEAVLRDPAAERQKRVEALKFLVHLVGDLHQPLHVGPLKDRGGNDVLVTWHGEPSNLHSVWDSGMIESTDLSYTELAEFIDHPTPEAVAEWQGTSVLVWAQESLELRPVVYDLGDRRLGYNYSYRVMPIVERRLLQAGVRLAGMLNSIFAAPAPPGS